MTVRVQQGGRTVASDLRSRLEGLEHLPIRAATARQVMSAATWAGLEAGAPSAETARKPDLCVLDPGWVIGAMTAGDRFDPLKLVAELPWWSSGHAAGARGEAFQRLWRHSVAVSAAARWLGREAGGLACEQLARAGLLHGLGIWAVAAIDPEWIVDWMAQQDVSARRDLEVSQLGMDLCDLGRWLAERWGCDPLVVDAVWLHDPSSTRLNCAAAEPQRLAIVQQAYRWANDTPWSLNPSSSQEGMPAEPRLRILVAEVQSRCGSLFAAADATTHEESMTRRSAQLTLRLAEALRTSESQGRLLQALADSRPSESAENWAKRVAIVWCGEPEVTAARVDWKPFLEATSRNDADEEAAAVEPPKAIEPQCPESRPPTLVIPLRAGGVVQAEIQLWCDRSRPSLADRLKTTPVLAAWEAWASLVAAQTLLERRLQAIVGAVRKQADDDDVRNRDHRLQALAQFAAGAGHELNNPLAVIVGRAQLLLGRSQDAETSRSLRIILSQAQRTHRILRDLIFVARPPEPRPRSCRPSEVLRGCLAGFQEECDARGVCLESDLEQTDIQTWADSDALGHLAESLIRNAIEATPNGGKVQIRSRALGNRYCWWFYDSGKGIGPTEGAHLFDPFYCGRQAGRGLGLGLPRAARIVALAGGSLRWSSSIGQGTMFQVQLPVVSPPEKVSTANA
jgi:signal transduction histidine kinase